jgi:D-amino-acid oxidase
MIYNIASYADRLTRDFMLRGGHMIRRDFPDRAAVLALPEPVIVNCTGFGAQRLWEDQSIIPVRGQNAMFAPQPEARYGVLYNSVSAVSRSDGVLVQQYGANDEWGVGDATDDVHPDETVQAVATLAPLFA